MIEIETSNKPEPPQAVQIYRVLCLAALGVILLVLYTNDFGYWSLIPVIVGLVGLLIQWTTAPLLVILAVAASLLLQNRLGVGFPWHENARVSDVILSAAVLGYVAAHFRVRSLSVHVFPVDPRRRERTPRGRKVVQQPRSPHLVTRREIGLLIVSLPVWALAGQIVWRVVPSEYGRPGGPSPLWLAWLVVILPVVIASLVGYWRRREMTPQEAALTLQDVVWQETRREQRSLNRWLAWARLRYARNRERQKPNRLTYWRERFRSFRQRRLIPTLAWWRRGKEQP
ncbi:MAG: hypothetical protein JO112_15605 [Planctomycetes bacterium]|nr:hypothetical protein [Planctomycetota bacterium]